MHPIDPSRVGWMDRLPSVQALTRCVTGGAYYRYIYTHLYIDEREELFQRTWWGDFSISNFSSPSLSPFRLLCFSFRAQGAGLRYHSYVLLFSLHQRFGPWFRCRLPSRSAHFAAFVDIILRGSGIHGPLFPSYFFFGPSMSRLHGFHSPNTTLSLFLHSRCPNIEPAWRTLTLKQKRDPWTIISLECQNGCVRVKASNLPR